MQAMLQIRFSYQAYRAWTTFTAVLLGVTLIVTASTARADLSSVILTQNGTSVNVDVSLGAGSFFEETTDGGGALFFFDDSVIISSITNIIATLNGAAVTIPGGLMGTTNSPVTTSAGTFTAFVQCKVPTDCDGVLDPTFINDLHFTVTNVTIAQLTVANDDGNVFLASLPLQVPEPATVALLGLGLAGIGFARRARSTH